MVVWSVDKFWNKKSQENAHIQPYKFLQRINKKSEKKKSGQIEEIVQQKCMKKENSFVNFLS